MKFADKEITSVVNLLSELKNWNIQNTPLWFRGHADISWKLIPSIARKKKQVNAEYALLKRFK